MKAIILFTIVFLTAFNANSQTIWYVNTTQNGTGDGTSWNNASSNLQAIINASNASDEIWVATGTYTPTIIPDPTNTDVRNKTFLLKNGIKLYGGFVGTETLLSQRNWVTNPTLLNGAGNVYHVIVSINNSTNIIIDGFTITGGFFSTSLTGTDMLVGGINIIPRAGAGLYVNSSNLSLINCTISGNNTTAFGGGMYIENNSIINLINTNISGNLATNAITFSGSAGGIYNSSSNLTMLNCNVSGNSSRYFGGGLANINATAQITNCKFQNNFVSRGSGAGIYNSVSSVVINKTLINNNNSFSSGSGIYNSSSNFILKNSFVVSNKFYLVPNAGWSGAGLANYNTVSKIINTVFNDNRIGASISGSAGAAIYNGNNSNTDIINCTITKNIAGQPGTGAIFNELNTTTKISNSIIWNNLDQRVFNGSQENIQGDGLVNASYSDIGINSASVYPGIGNVKINPIFFDEFNAAGADTIFGTADDGLSLKRCSPVINNGINDSLPVGTTTDIIDSSRIQLGTVDMGAYEQSEYAICPIANSNTQISLHQNSFGLSSYQSAASAFGIGCDNTILKIQLNILYQALEATNARVWIEPTQPAMFVKRHYQISNLLISPQAAKVTLYFKQQDFDEFNLINTVKLPSSPTDSIGISNLKIEKREGTSSNDTGLPSTYTGTITTIDPNNNDIVWNATLNAWEVSFIVNSFSGFFVKTTTSVLPLTLIDFQCIFSNNLYELNWITANEQNTKEFVVEYSIDGQSFSTLTTVPAKNNGSFTYTYMDNSVYQNSIIYYRLKMIDLNNSYNYSKIISCKRVSTNMITVIPNPANDFVNIRINGSSNLQKTMAVIYDNLGKKLMVFKLENSNQKINISSLSKGQYFIRFANGYTTSFEKL